MNQTIVITMSSVLTALILGVRQALFTGIIPTGIIIARGAPVFKVVSRWITYFLIVVTIGTILTHFLGPHIFMRFSDIEYLLVLFIGPVNVIFFWVKQNPITKLLSSDQWLYFIAVVQGINATVSIGAIYALSSDVSVLLLGVAAILYTLTYCSTVFVFNIIIDLISKSQPRARSIIIFLLALFGILVNLVHYFL